MKSFASFVIAGALLLPVAPVASAHEKPLPPAFGKELVPDQETEERNEPKESELEDEKDDKAAHHTARHSEVPYTGHGKIHVQLDGDEDGGDSGGDDDDGL